MFFIHIFCFVLFARVKSYHKKKYKKIKFKSGLMTSFILLLNLSAMQRMQKDICKKH